MNRLARWARKFGVARAVCLVLLFALVPLRIWDPRMLEEARLRSFDFYQVLRPREQKLHPVTIVDIDEASLRDIGQWPWPRTVVADLITKLTAMGAVSIGFDIIFAEPDRMSPANAAASFRNLDDATREKLQNLPSNDDVFADAISHSRVVLGQSAATFLAAKSPPGLPQTGIAIRGPDPTRFLDHYPELLTNVPALEKAAAGRGVITVANERDGITRRAPVILDVEGRIVPSLTLEMLRVAIYSEAILVRADQAGVQNVAFPRFLLPTDGKGRLWIHFNRFDPTRYISAKDVLAGTAPVDKIKQKLVLIGTSAIGLLDVKTTPIDAVLPGVEVHAQILESIFESSVLSAPNWAIVAELAVALFVGIAIIAAAPILSAATVIALGGILIAAMIAVSFYFFVAHNLLIDFTYPLMSSWLLYLVLTFVNYFREQKQRQQIRSAFGFYLSPQLVEQLARSPERLVLGGEERRMTILFSDVRGFTGISEYYKDDPQGLTRLMNCFLTPLTNAIIERKGTIDKYIGDAIMAFWNAPVDDAEQEANACDAALEMLSRADALNVELKREAEENGGKYMPLRIGIGLNTGPCVVGNMGSDFRFNYSVLGDTVNVASRLEARTKDYRIPMVIGSRTAEQAQGKFATMEIDLIQVKGKTQPESVYTVLGRAEVEQDPRCKELRELNARLLTQYRSQHWDEALETIEQCRSAANGFPIGPMYEMYVERIEAFRADPPPPDWNGVYEAELK